ncbi:MAG: ABC-type nitrate/sulfonate/bicarbonate transport system substrate-binding protein [Gammaproteobacteria bacterium]
MDSIRIGAVSRNYFNLPLWIAQHCGMFADEHINADVHLIEGIAEVDQRLNDLDLDIALSVTENIILYREQGSDLTVLGGNVNRLPFSFIARQGIASLAQLRGMKIGVSAIESGSSSLIMRLLEGVGLRYPADYTLIPCGPIWARWHMLENGEIDAGLQGAPLNYMALDAGYVDLGDPREVFPDFQFVSLNSSQRWIASHRDLLIRFLRAFIRAHHWFYANKQASSAIAVEEMGIDAAYADRAWEEFVRDEIFPRDGAASVKSIETLIDVSALIRAIPSRSTIRAQDYIDHSYLEQARKSLADDSVGLASLRPADSP